MHPMLLRVLVPAIVLAALGGLPSAQAQSHNQPNVIVENGNIRVDPDPIRLRRSQVINGRWQILWVLSRADGYRFTDDGITLHPAEEDGRLPDDLRCFKLSNGVRFTCSFKPRLGAFNYKYDVNLLDPSGTRISVDPIINTDF